MANKRRCVCCGKYYSYCPICSNDKLKPTWYFIYHDEKCKILDEILSKHTNGRITTEQAKKEIIKNNLVNYKIDLEDNKRHFDEIMSFKLKSETSPEKKIDVRTTSKKSVNKEIQ